MKIKKGREQSSFLPFLISKHRLEYFADQLK